MASSTYTSSTSTAMSDYTTSISNLTHLPRSILASLTSNLSLSTSSLSRSLAPVELDGASYPHEHPGVVKDALKLFEKSVDEVHAIAKNGRGFHLKDVVRVLISLPA